MVAGLLASWLTVHAQAADNIALSTAQAQINTAIQQYLADLKDNRYTRMDADVQPLDNRLRLDSCTGPLEVEHQPRDRIGGRITLKATCTAPGGWSVRVPATVQLFDQVVVAGASIPAGSRLSPRDLQQQEMDVALLSRGYYSAISQVAGFVAKRPIPAGQVLSPVTVNPANLVSKGETVSIVAEGPGLTIRALGIALSDGAMGQLIQVRNSKTNKVVEGRISAPGQIKVTL